MSNKELLDAIREAVYADNAIIVNGNNALEVVRKYDLASQANIDTRMIEL
jgi:hypothetical protein